MGKGSKDRVTDRRAFGESYERIFGTRERGSGKKVYVTVKGRVVKKPNSNFDILPIPQMPDEYFKHRNRLIKLAMGVKS